MSPIVTRLGFMYAVWKKRSNSMETSQPLVTCKRKGVIEGRRRTSSFFSPPANYYITMAIHCSSSNLLIFLPSISSSSSSSSSSPALPLLFSQLIIMLCYIFATFASSYLPRVYVQPHIIYPFVSHNNVMESAMLIHADTSVAMAGSPYTRI